MSPRRVRQSTLGLLDIGSAKIAAAVIVVDQDRVDGANGLRVAGLGMQKSRGVKSGLLNDLDAAEDAVRAAVAQAERAAGLGIDSVAVSVSCGQLASSYFTARADVEAGVVRDADIARAFSGGRAYAERNGRMLVHLNALGYGLDGAMTQSHPRGLAGRNLAARMHAVTADEMPLRNLLMLIERCHLQCDGLIAAPYASGLAVTTAEERALGVIAIDMGAGTTSSAVFADGRLVATDVVPVGAQHITIDIAKALQTPLGEAERIKTLYGTLISAQSDQNETFSYTLSGEEEGATYDATRAQLTAIIRPRIAHTLETIVERLRARGQWAQCQQIVLTGGGSQLIGCANFASSIFGCRARLGRPGGLSGVPSSGATGPIAAVLGLGLALHEGSVVGETGDVIGASSFGKGESGYLGRVGSWLRAGF